MVSRRATWQSSGALRLAGPAAGPTAGPAAEPSGVAHFAVGGLAVSLGMSAEAMRHLQLAAPIRRELAVRSRAQIAEWVAEHRLGSSPDARGAVGAGRGDKAGGGR